MALDAHWLQAYGNTSFFVNTPRGRLCLRVGHANVSLDELLAAEGARSWAYVTAFNPGSVLLSEDENLRRQVALERHLAEAGFRVYPGEGVGDDGRWPAERSLLILRIARVVAIELGRRFGQRAIVYGEAGGGPELVPCLLDAPERCAKPDGAAGGSHDAV